MDAELLVKSPIDYAVELYGPVSRESSWQSVQDAGFDQSHFRVDWERKQVYCPQNKVTTKWQPGKDAVGNAVIFARFPRAGCASCEQRPLCTKSKTGPRELCLRPQEQYLALQMARVRQKTAEFQKAYGLRAGIEGTLSQGVRVCGLRRSRYIGKAKTHLQNVMIATALNLVRMVSFVLGIPVAQTRRSPLVMLAQLNGVVALPQAV